MTVKLVWYVVVNSKGVPKSIHEDREIAAVNAAVFNDEVALGHKVIEVPMPKEVGEQR